MASNITFRKGFVIPVFRSFWDLLPYTRNSTYYVLNSVARYTSMKLESFFVCFFTFSSLCYVKGNRTSSCLLACFQIESTLILFFLSLYIAYYPVCLQNEICPEQTFKLLLIYSIMPCRFTRLGLGSLLLY